MDKDFIEKSRAALIEERNEIMASLADQSEQMQRLVGSVETGDEADRASDRIDETLLNALSEASSRRLTMIDNALDRIKNGQYGICKGCGREIAMGRLEAIPYAALCIDCQTKVDRQGR
ncbi:MAG: TraR/DksA family transcriptional regulator [Treponema sp.]|nr:TraR/DksA family transcriptional regulator [Treponema sp.]